MSITKRHGVTYPGVVLQEKEIIYLQKDSISCDTDCISVKQNGEYSFWYYSRFKAMDLAELFYFVPSTYVRTDISRME